MFSHLSALGLPEPLLATIHNIYEGDLYVLIDGDKVVQVQPSKGVKQGCLLNPTLFTMFISDLPTALRRDDPTVGACTADPHLYVPHEEMADDLALLANLAANLRLFLLLLRIYT